MENIATAGFLIAATVYGALGALLMTLWRNQSNSGLLGIAFLTSCAWGAWLTAVGANAWSANPFVMAGAEVLRLGVWLFVLNRMLMTLGSTGRIRNFSGVAVVAVFLVIAAASINDIAGATNVALHKAVFLAILPLSLLSMHAVEQIFHNAPPASRRALKLVCIGLAVIFIYDIVLSSLVLLNSPIKSELINARGYVVLVAFPLLALGFHRDPSWSLQLFVSRQAATYLVSVIAIATYVAIIVSGTIFVRSIGGTWSEFAQVLLITVAIAFLAALMVSQTIWTRIKVFVDKNFYETRYDYRKEWLRFVATLADVNLARPIREVAVRAMGQIVESPSGILWTRSRNVDGWRATSAWNEEAPDFNLPDDGELPLFLESRQWVIEIPESIHDPELYGHLVLPEFIFAKPKTWLIVPLLYEETMVGFIMLHEPSVLNSLNYEDRDLLKAVGRLIATGLLKDQADRRLDETQRFEAYSKFSAFVMHDLNNIIAQLSLVVGNAVKHRDNPKFVEDAFETINNAVRRMTGLMTKLRSGDVQQRSSRTNLIELVQRAVSNCAGQLPQPDLESITNDLYIVADGPRLLEVLVHVIRNAQDATESEGKVLVSICERENQALVMVEDDGVGMTQSFIQNELFSPFVTTKGAKGMGIGMYQLREHVRSSGGSVNVVSEPGVGTSVEITFPIR